MDTVVDLSEIGVNLVGGTDTGLVTGARVDLALVSAKQGTVEASGFGSRLQCSRFSSRWLMRLSSRRRSSGTSSEQRSKPRLYQKVLSKEC